jgi:hypothetical protein
MLGVGCWILDELKFQPGSTFLMLYASYVYSLIALGNCTEIKFEA